jgi:hypothetical protein
MSTSTRRPTTIAAPTTWMEYGRCRETDPNIFFPEGRGAAITIQTAQAKAVCRNCPVRSLCLEWALDTGQSTGVWGGLSEDERRDLARVPEPSMDRCLNAQAWIEEQLAAGRGQREIARELGVDPGVLGRAVQRFRDEQALDAAAGEVAAA